MSFQVLITAQAERDLDDAAAWIAERAPQAAARWYDELRSAILSLADSPQRCALARESGHFPYELRQLLHGRRRSYRVIFTIRENSVVVLAIRHAARRDLQPEDLSG
jgi:plasmid stabilization system protein ParE